MLVTPEEQEDTFAWDINETRDIMDPAGLSDRLSVTGTVLKLSVIGSISVHSPHPPKSQFIFVKQPGTITGLRL
jgi:hypothetical protein